MSIRISELPLSDRPREKLLTKGPASLTDGELLAILLGSGSQSLPVADICENLLARIPLRSFAERSVREFCTVKGIGEVRALQLLAVAELADRMHHVPAPILADHQAICDYVKPRLNRETNRYYLLVLLNTLDEVLAVCEIGYELPYLNAVLEIIRESGAASVQLVRNGKPGIDPAEKLFLNELRIAAGALSFRTDQLLVVFTQTKAID